MRGSSDEDSFALLSWLLLFLLVLNQLPGLGDQQQGQRHHQQHGGEAESKGQKVHQGLRCLLHSDNSMWSG